MGLKNVVGVMACLQQLALIDYMPAVPTTNSMTPNSYWRTALPTYMRLSFAYAVTLSVGPLAIAILATLWAGFRTGRWPSTGIALVFIFSVFFFFLALSTAVLEDIRRSRTAKERTIAWNPQLVWRNFIYLSAVGLFVAAFLSYHQGAWLSVGFLAFSIGSLMTARRCF